MIKKKYHHGDLKNTFLQISFEFIEKHDIDKLTLKYLSDITGTSRSAIYSHFNSKEALIESMILEGFRCFDDCLSPILKDFSIPVQERLRHASRAYIKFARTNKVLYRLLFGHRYASVRMEVMTKNDPDKSGFGALMYLIEDGQRAKQIKGDNPYQKTIVIWSMLHGLSSLLIDGFIGIEDMYDDLFEDMFQNILHSLLWEE